MEKIELLQSVSIFWDLNENDLGHIADKMVQNILKMETIFS